MVGSGCWVLRVQGRFWLRDFNVRVWVCFNRGLGAGLSSFSFFDVRFGFPVVQAVRLCSEGSFLVDVGLLGQELLG